MRLSRPPPASVPPLIAALLTLPTGAFAATGTITGTVTGAGGGGPVVGLRVCADGIDSTFDSTCTTTNATGAYSMALQEDSYRIDFESSGEYLGQWYPAVATQAAATVVTVTAGAS